MIEVNQLTLLNIGDNMNKAHITLQRYQEMIFKFICQVQNNIFKPISDVIDTKIYHIINRDDPDIRRTYNNAILVGDMGDPFISGLFEIELYFMNRYTGFDISKIIRLSYPYYGIPSRLVESGTITSEDCRIIEDIVEYFRDVLIDNFNGKWGYVVDDLENDSDEFIKSINNIEAIISEYDDVDINTIKLIVSKI